MKLELEMFTQCVRIHHVYTYYISNSLTPTFTQQLRATADEANPTHCWVSVEIVHGAYAAEDLQHDMVQLKFDRAVPLKV